ncbi:hypothetical protein [Streptomyces sp. NBRC 110028]|uniref:hypothetical protein n=1 Tax=Streptomyces sp. NBRC 110028 TaxID=1621260 RepID=UPI0018FEA39F|nr:hypothetical protein [Streptomyces sp. NBRC 110028]
MEPVAVPQVHRAEAQTAASGVTGVVRAVGGEPEHAFLGRDAAQGRVEDGVHDLVRHDPALADRVGEGVDERRVEPDPVPAPQVGLRGLSKSIAIMGR